MVMIPNVTQTGDTAELIVPCDERAVRLLGRRIRVDDGYGELVEMVGGHSPDGEMHLARIILEEEEDAS